MPKVKTNGPELHRKAGRARAAGLRAFGRAIFGASAAYEAAIEQACAAEGIRVADLMAVDREVLDPKLGADNEWADVIRSHQRGVVLAAFVGDFFMRGNEFHVDGLARIERLAEAMRPPTKPKDEAVGLAKRLVEEFAEKYQLAAKSGAPLSKSIYDLSATGLAHSLVLILTADVHRGFRILRAKLRHVSELLADYEPSTGRRTIDGKGEGKRSAANIVSELNTLAGYPLGQKLTTRAVGTRAPKGAKSKKQNP